MKTITFQSFQKKAEACQKALSLGFTAGTGEVSGALAGQGAIVTIYEVHMIATLGPNLCCTSPTDFCWSAARFGDVWSRKLPAIRGLHIFPGRKDVRKVTD